MSSLSYSLYLFTLPLCIFDNSFRCQHVKQYHITSLLACLINYLSIYSLNILNALIRSLCSLVYSPLTAIYSLLYQHNKPHKFTLYLIKQL